MRRLSCCSPVSSFRLALQGCAERRIPAEFQAYADTPYALGAGDRAAGDRVRPGFAQQFLRGGKLRQYRHAADRLGPAQPAARRPSSRGEIEARLRAGYIREPRVSVEVEAYRPFFILGEVTTAGQYPYVNGMSVETAVAIAGGYTPRARKDDAQLTRTEGARTVTADVPVTVPVRPGDTIFIPERYF